MSEKLPQEILMAKIPDIMTVLALSIRQFAALLIHRIAFLSAFGDHNFEKEAVVHWISHIYCTVWLGEAMLQVACGSSNL